MDNSPGKASQVLGKYLSRRGRTSTNIIQTLFTPARGEVEPTRRSGNESGHDYASTIGNASHKPGGDGVAAKSCSSRETISKLSPADIFMKNNPIVGNQEVTSPPSVNYRVHGADAKEYAMRALGNVDTLLNRYGYEDSKQRRFEY